MLRIITTLWKTLRYMSGDDAYERYLNNFSKTACDMHQPLSRKAFFQEQQVQKWQGIKRCC